MQDNVSDFLLKIKVIAGRDYVYGNVRKKYILLTPEEWVRQQVILLLNQQLNIPFSRMAVERQIKNSKKRFDIVIFEQETGDPMVLIECKRKSEKLSQATFNQISGYNYDLKVPYLVITNWVEWRAAEIVEGEFKMLSGFPAIK